MRLNRGTIAILLISIVAIVGVLLLNNSQVTAPSDATNTPTPEPGPLFAEIDPNLLTRLEIIDPTTGLKTVLTRTTGAAFANSVVEQVATEEVAATAEVSATDEAAATEEAVSTEEVAATEEMTATEEAAPTEVQPTPTLDPSITVTPTLAPDQPIWVIAEASVLADRPSNYTEAEKAIAVFSGLLSSNQLTEVNLADIGLTNPRYTLIGTASDGKVFRVDVGAKSISTPGYFVLVNGDQSTVYQVPADMIDSLVNLINDPPYMPSPTMTFTPSVTPNPYSEVQQTQTAEVEQTSFAVTQAAIDAAATLSFGAESLISTPAAP